MAMRPTTFWCTECGAETIWALADQLAAILGVCPRTVYHWLEKGRVHSRRLAKSGLRLYCLCSVCGHPEGSPGDGGEAKFVCKGLQQCAMLSLAAL